MSEAAEEERVSATDPDPHRSSPGDQTQAGVTPSPEDSPDHEDKHPVGDGGQNQVSEAEGKAEAERSAADYNVQPSEESAFRMDQEIYVDPAVVQKLSEGFLQRFLPSLEKSKSSIDEILNNQTVVVETLEQENAKFKECTAHLDLSAMMVKAKNYHNKLLTIKRDMASLHDKAAKLKKRALKLQQQKQKEELQRAHQEERELEKEQMLTARVASPQS